MRVLRLVAFATAIAFCGSAYGYSITHSYSGGQTTEYYGACDSGAMFMLVDAGNQTFRYEGPNGAGKVQGSRDSAARAACGE